MLVLLFNLGTERYALEAKEVVEIVPMVPLRPLRQTPPFVVGLFPCRGEVVPVVDLRQLICQEPCLERLSTRIIVVRCPVENGETPLLGLLAERVTEAALLQDAEFKGEALAVQDAPYLGRVALANGELVQMIRLSRILSKTVRDSLFKQV
jgi:chemotaxis-related protein WspB